MTTYNPRMPHVEINGAPATTGDLSIAMASYGHFTSMQVREGAVRGLGLHLQRLGQSTQRLFGSELEIALVRSWLGQALRNADAIAAASVRVVIVSSSFDRDRPEASRAVDVIIAISPPVRRHAAPIRVQLRLYERDLPEVKHLATFGLLWQRREARLAGYDDALFENRQGCVSEGSVWNVGFWDGFRVVWPQAPMLDGISQQLIKPTLGDLGLASVRREVFREDLPYMQAAFACNAGGPIVPIVGIDDSYFAASMVLATRLQDGYDGLVAERV